MLEWLKTHYHKVALVFWVFMVIPTVIWWKDSVLWVALMSLYANVWISLQVLMQKEDS